MYWDNLHGIDDDAVATNVNNSVSEGNPSADIPPEHTALVLASNGNTDNDYEMPELLMRRKTADALLNQIRELIADKSFRYTEHIRAAPRKGVRTRARTTLVDLDRQLSFLCQVYSYCRGRMVVLGADRELLTNYRLLTHDDVRCSTAVLKPNMPGSTQLKLSWIWQSIDRRIMADPTENMDTSDPATLLECKCTLRPFWL